MPEYEAPKTGRDVSRRSLTGTALMLMLFALFALFALLMVLYGARIYTRVVSVMDDGYSVRASLSYITNKVHTADTEGAIALETLGDTPALTLDTGEGMLTLIYYHDGALSESTVGSRDVFDPEAGTRLVELSSFTMEADGNKYTFTATTGEGTRRAVTVYTRTGVSQ